MAFIGISKFYLSNQSVKFINNMISFMFIEINIKINELLTFAKPFSDIARAHTLSRVHLWLEGCFDLLSEGEIPQRCLSHFRCSSDKGFIITIKKAALATCDLFLLNHDFNLPSFFYDVIPSLTASYPVLIYNDLIVTVFYDLNEMALLLSQVPYLWHIHNNLD